MRAPWSCGRRTRLKTSCRARRQPGVDQRRERGGEPVDEGLIERQVERRASQVLGIADESRRLLDQPKGRDGHLFRDRILRQVAPHDPARGREDRQLLGGDEVAEHVAGADVLPGEQAHVAAELVSLRQRDELLADEARERLPTGQRLTLGIVDAGVVLERRKRAPQHLAIKPLLAAEMVVDGGPVGLGATRDVADRAGREALLGKDRERRRDQGLAGKVGGAGHATLHDTGGVRGAGPRCARRARRPWSRHCRRRGQGCLVASGRTGAAIPSARSRRLRPRR